MGIGAIYVLLCTRSTYRAYRLVFVVLVVAGMVPHWMISGAVGSGYAQVGYTLRRLFRCSRERTPSRGVAGRGYRHPSLGDHQWHRVWHRMWMGGMRGLAGTTVF